MNRLLIHHHATVYIDTDNGDMYTTSFIGVWLNEISRHVDKIGMLFFTSSCRLAKHDTKITQSNIVLESLGNPGNYTDKLAKNQRIKDKCQGLSGLYDKLLIRGITPAQFLVFKNIKVDHIYYLLVGSIVSSKPKFNLSFVGIIQYLYHKKRLFEIRQIAKKAIMLVNSPALVFELQENMNISSIYIPTNTLSKNQIRPQRNWHKPEIVKLFFCGRVVRDKGIFELLEAFYILSKKGIKCELSIAGELGNDIMEEFKSLSYWSQIESKIRILGFVPFGDQLLDIYSRHNLFVLPTYHEGFPHCIWESAATSTPIIVSRVGGIPGILSSKHVKLIQPRKVNELIEAILDTLNSHETNNERNRIMYDLLQENTLESGVEKLMKLINKPI